MPPKHRPRRESRSSSTSASSCRLMSVDFLTSNESAPPANSTAGPATASAVNSTAYSPLLSQNRYSYEERARPHSIPPTRHLFSREYDRAHPVLPGVRELTSGIPPYPSLAFTIHHNQSPANHYTQMPYQEYPILHQSQSLKPKRKRATTAQLTTLNRIFEKTFFPSTELRARLGSHLGMHPRTVQIWFQNRRQQWRAQNGECGGTTDDERGAWQVLQMEFGAA